MKFFLFFLIAYFSVGVALAGENGDTGVGLDEKNKKTVYVYKQFEKFDFDVLNIEGGSGNPSDISISSIHEKRFTNHLPYRKSFTLEIKKGIERVQ